MKFLKYYIMFMLGVSISLGNLPEDPAEYARWEKSLLAAIEVEKKSPPEQAIPKIGKWVGQLSDGPNIEKGDRPVFKAAQSALLAIPGHAEYYADHLNKLRLEFEKFNTPDESNITNRGFIQSALTREQMYSFQTLKQLPSAETVKVLGEFLSDERGRLVIPPDYKGNKMRLLDHWGEEPNSTKAAYALEALPLKSKPHAKISYWDKETLRPWQLWYEQIKAGRRTFSFEGDPQEYDLTGPVREARSPDVVRATKRPGAAENINAVTEKPASSSATIWVISGLVTLGLGGYFYARKTKSI